MTRGGATYYYQTNAHGDVIALTDSAGAVVNTYTYDPWGKVLTSTGTVSNPLRYAGYYYDDSTGLYYLSHRYYDPQTSRFITVDPASYVTGERYTYAGDNPTSLTDPTGLSWLSDAFDWANENLNPAYPMLVAYGNELDAYNAGKSLWTVAKCGGTAVFYAGMTTMAVGGMTEFACGVRAGWAGEEGATVYRAWGDGAGPNGSSWTTVNPNAVVGFRAAAGLPDANAGRFVSEGIIRDPTGIVTKIADSLDGNPGGIVELVIPDPAAQVVLTRVSGVNPPF
jgi:RHS repeat-associated protein